MLNTYSQNTPNLWAVYPQTFMGIFLTPNPFGRFPPLALFNGIAHTCCMRSYGIVLCMVGCFSYLDDGGVLCIFYTRMLGMLVEFKCKVHSETLEMMYRVKVVYCALISSICKNICTLLYQ